MAGGYLRFDIPYLKQIPVAKMLETSTCQYNIIILVDKFQLIYYQD
jgi:hypothetical protein